MDLAIANLLAKGAVREVQSQDDQFTSTYFWYKKKMASFGQLSYLRALNRFLGKESFKMKGLQVVIYIDDMLLLHQQSQVLQTLFAQVVAFLENLGFQVKMEKCSVVPSQCIVFLGAQLYSTTVTLSLSQLKLRSILGDCQLTAPRTSCTALQPTWRRRRSCVLPQIYQRLSSFLLQSYFKAVCFSMVIKGLTAGRN